MRYAFLVETYATERVKVVSVWSEFRDEDLPVRPRDGRSPRTQRARADGPSVRERGFVVPQIWELMWGTTAAESGDADRVHQAVCGGQRKAAALAAGKGRGLVGGRGEVF